MNVENVPSYSTAKAIGMKKIKEYDDGEEFLLVYAIKREEWQKLKNCT